ncbi:MAG TPA: NAD(P)/FAD-dependent oxidoreductase [Bryobacteraceae bacterium]|nr:NAD(P)/FAD-dependent oxidoreductase [Bryobacteraceae bacterium]
MIGYRQQNIANRYDAIVVGSGAGGLTAAVLLAKYGGQRVLVLERHYAPGGFTQSFRRPGFDWDVGLHYIGQLHDPRFPLQLLFDRLTDGRLEWSPLPEVYDRILIGERCYEFWSGEERFRRKMKEYFPEEGGAIDQYLTRVNECAAAMQRYFAERALPPILSRLFGGLMRRPFLRFASRTTAEVLGELTDNRQLAAVLTGQWGCYGLPPSQSSFGIHAIVAQHYFDGGSYPRGGAARIAEALAPAIEAKGGTVALCAEVDRILVEARKRAIGVRMADGREIFAGRVISDAGAANTFRRLLPEHLPGVDAVLGEIGSIPPSIAHVCLYLGLEGSSPELGLSGTHLWVYPDQDHDGNLQRLFSDPDAPLSVMISSASAKDPDFERRHPGHSTAEIASLVPYEWFRNWEHTHWRKRGPDYEAYKALLTERLLDAFYRYVPAARGHVRHAELSTPLSTRDCVNHPHGEIYGLAHTPRRFKLRCLGPRTPVPNLYLTGGDAATCGVMGASTGGILAASAILHRNLFSALLNA